MITSKLIIGIYDAATGEDLFKRKGFAPLGVSVSKSLYGGNSTFEIPFNPATDYRVLTRLLPFNSRIRIDIARYPQDEGFGPICLHGIVRGLGRSEEFGNGSRSIRVYGTCIGGAIVNYEIFYNRFTITGPDMLIANANTKAALLNYWAFAGKGEGDQRKAGFQLPSKFIDALMQDMVTKVPAGGSAIIDDEGITLNEDFSVAKELASLKDSKIIDESGNIRDSFGYNDSAALIPWTEWINDAQLDMQIMQNTNLDGSLWAALDKLRFKAFQCMWTDTHPTTGRLELNYHKYPFQDSRSRLETISDFTTPTAIVDRSDIQAWSLDRNDDDAFNLFWATNTPLTRTQLLEFWVKTQAPVLLSGDHPSSVDRIGLREMSIRDPHVYDSALHAARVTSKWIANWHEWNPQLWKGSITMPVNNRVRPGYTLIVRDAPESIGSRPDFECFVTNVSYSGNFGSVGSQTASMSATVTRGLYVPRTVENRWYLNPEPYTSRSIYEMESVVKR